MTPTLERKKDSINATVSPSIKRRVVELVKSGKYSSMSDVVTQALNKLLDENARKDQLSKTRSCETNHNNKENEQFERDIWKQKGMIYQKMGKLEEAIKCYDKALGIDSTEDNEKTTKKTKTVKEEGDVEILEEFVLE
ncbi:tetratricopeptide repeat protein [Methanosarcina acetivorans]|uniref:Uncharacterized protein n=1 Tax=Methanosarcina acetivorans (strain ATCC 35395 / DSM 2834 / JCM 12185 / C2A) TaxID=188937 RepID=Q8TMP4_METAC|nr:tetratricopeptide repeat protein [Methanosarcina acetivorans]AAM05990.1 hypothetical protein (multi-domain) [Methanosarcina acetivorans C2A]